VYNVATTDNGEKPPKIPVERMELNQRQNIVLVGFLTLSLLLHLLLFYLLPQRSLFPPPPAEKPVVVEVRPPQEPPKQLERELDLPTRPDLEKPRETPAKRLGPSDQVVKRETAPKGADTEDRTPSMVRPQPERQARPRVQPRVRPQPKPEAPPESRTPLAEQPTPTGPPRTSEEQSSKAPAQKLPDLRTLTQLPPQTLARLEDDWRRKYRKDVEEGDAVWLDTEKDILSSFFQRFRDQIYGVWNYPSSAAEKGEQGTCMLKISVNRDGTLKGVELKESSGFPVLDNEAIAAVKKAAPYGPVSKYYKDDVLNIFAFFQYNLSRRTIY
jgi:protein TonB